MLLPLSPDSFLPFREVYDVMPEYAPPAVFLLIDETPEGTQCNACMKSARVKRCLHFWFECPCSLQGSTTFAQPVAQGYMAYMWEPGSLCPVACSGGSRTPLWRPAECTERVVVFRERLACRFVFASFADKYKQPSKLSPAIAATNMHLQRFAESNDRVTYVDCNAVLLEEVGVLCESTLTIYIHRVEFRCHVLQHPTACPYLQAGLVMRRS